MNTLLGRSSVYIHLDPRHEDVRVPAWFKKQPQLVLQVGLSMAVRIPDLDVGEDAVSCTLSFNRAPFFCYVPWSAVFALLDEAGKGMIWPNDVPREVVAQQADRVQKEQARERMRPVSSEPQKPGASAGGLGSAAKSPNKKRAQPPALRAEKRPPEGDKPRTPSPAKESHGSRDGKKPLPSYLRVVK
jgi:stringent starvation protein B